MKITNPPPTPPRQPQNATKTAPRRDGATADGAQGPDASSELPGRDFASVLDEATRTRQDEREQETSDAERRDTKDSTRTHAERPAKRRDERRDGKGDDGSNASHSGGGFHSSSMVREGPRGEVMNARAILHIADLEKLVATVRTQVLQTASAK